MHARTKRTVGVNTSSSQSNLRINESDYLQSLPLGRSRYGSHLSARVNRITRFVWW